MPINQSQDTNSLLKNDKDQRAGMTVVPSGFSYDNARNTTVTLVTAANNTNGIIIRILYGATGAVSADYSGLKVEGQILFPTHEGNGSGAFNYWFTNIYIEAGQEVEIKSNDAKMQVIATYEVL